MRPRLIAMATVTSSRRSGGRARTFASRVPTRRSSSSACSRTTSTQDADVFDALLLTPKARLVAPLRVWRRGEDDFLLLTEPELGDDRALDAPARALRGEVRDRARGAHVDARVRRRGRPAGRAAGDGRGARRADSSATLDDEELERARIEARRSRLGQGARRVDPPRRGGARRARTSRSRRAAIPGRSRSRACTTAATSNRGLRVLDVEAAQPGDEIRLGDKVVGRVTSAVRGPRARLRAAWRFPTTPSSTSPGSGRGSRAAALLDERDLTARLEHGPLHVVERLDLLNPRLRGDLLDGQALATQVPSRSAARPRRRSSALLRGSAAAAEPGSSGRT